VDYCAAFAFICNLPALQFFKGFTKEEKRMIVAAFGGLKYSAVNEGICNTPPQLGLQQIETKSNL
jgi:hypothetical protein